MKARRLKIAVQDFEELQRLVLADMPREAGAFALASMAETAASIDVIIRRPVAIPKEHFSIQHESRLEISPRAINGLIALCESNELGAVLCHSHPRNIPYSSSDDQGERRIFEVLKQFIPPQAPMASLLFYPGGVQGRVWLADSRTFAPISEIVVIGRRIRRIRPNTLLNNNIADIGEIYDRQVRAFGKHGQALISQAKVGIIGVGGTGSPTAEQLVRMGVEDVLLVDPDEFEASNITRVYGTFAEPTWRRWWRRLTKRRSLKVELVANHLRQINPNANIRTIAQSVVLQEAASQLLDRDVIFLCTDDHWGRSVVNQIAYQYFIPTLNLGMRIASTNGTDGEISGAAGVIDILRPDKPCLWCSQFLRSERIAAESMPLKARKPLEEEHYVEGLDTPTPSVVSATTALSGGASTLFLQLLTGFMGPAGDVTRLNYNFMDGTVRRGRTKVANECICMKVRGAGELKPLPVVSQLP